APGCPGWCAGWQARGSSPSGPERQVPAADRPSGNDIWQESFAACPVQASIAACGGGGRQAIDWPSGVVRQTPFTVRSRKVSVQPSPAAFELQAAIASGGGPRCGGLSWPAKAAAGTNTRLARKARIDVSIFVLQVKA